ncbi:MAG TPA: metallophosphoesterase [Myxococcaceae bacterium]|nr:metallophosphoesterase [Myxococcaceae bacterium]
MRRILGMATTLVVWVGAVALFAVGSNRKAAAGPDLRAPLRQQSSEDSRLVAWVVLGANGQVIARAITSRSNCPIIELDNTRYQMSLRAQAETIPQRPTTSDPSQSRPSVFPVTTCEYFIPAGTQTAIVSDEAQQRLLPLPKPNPQRIVILGDTGCRLHIGDPWQACNDVEEWPFRTIAEMAAGFEPDLVLHVGDYQYRENKCPVDIAGCVDAGWGYGWDTWDADLFTPGAALLAAAPWIMVRGNHEECARAGQGWYRFLDTQPYQTNRTCNDPANDAVANYNDPYAVAIGDDTQVIVFDSSKVTTAPLQPSDPAFVNYQNELRRVAELAQARPKALSMWANHHPLLAFSPLPGTDVRPGNPALLSVMYATYGDRYYPPGIGLALHGHTHILELLNFSSNHPPTFMMGNGGDNLDLNLPDPFPTDAHPDSDFASAVNVRLDASGRAEVAHTNMFGFVVADREGDREWTFRAYTRHGRLLTTCAFVDGQSSCSDIGFLHEPPKRRATK